MVFSWVVQVIKMKAMINVKETLNLISGDEASVDDDPKKQKIFSSRKRCPKCDTSMDNYLIDEYRKLHVCGKNPDCDGYLS